MVHLSPLAYQVLYQVLRALLRRLRGPYLRGPYLLRSHQVQPHGTSPPVITDTLPIYQLLTKLLRTCLRLLPTPPPVISDKLPIYHPHPHTTNPSNQCGPSPLPPQNTPPRAKAVFFNVSTLKLLKILQVHPTRSRDPLSGPTKAPQQAYTKGY